MKVNPMLSKQPVQLHDINRRFSIDNGYKWQVKFIQKNFTEEKNQMKLPIETSLTVKYL